MNPVNIHVIMNIYSVYFVNTFEVFQIQTRTSLEVKNAPQMTIVYKRQKLESNT